MYTPDQQTTPDDDKPTHVCHDCNGNKEIVIFDEDDGPDTEKCPTCKGEGVLEMEEGDDW